MSDMKDGEQNNPPKEEIMSALFAHLVVQQANLAMMMLGKTPHPETGETMHDLQAAKLFVDMLEMLEAKTKGNLNPQEQTMLKQTLMTVRMAFVEAANESPKQEAKAPEPASKPAGPVLEQAPAAAEESHKKFSKKY
jgi:hypothetical protein